MLYSNLSATHLQLGQKEAALEAARSSVQLAPKGFHMVRRLHITYTHCQPIVLCVIAWHLAIVLSCELCVALMPAGVVYCMTLHCRRTCAWWMRCMALASLRRLLQCCSRQWHRTLASKPYQSTR